MGHCGAYDCWKGEFCVCPCEPCQEADAEADWDAEEERRAARTVVPF